MRCEIKGYNDQRDLHKTSWQIRWPRQANGILSRVHVLSKAVCVICLLYAWVCVESMLAPQLRGMKPHKSNRSPEWRDQLQDLFPARYRLLTCLQDLSQKSRNAKAAQLFYMLLWFTFSFMTPFKINAGVFWSTSSGLHKALAQPLGMVVRSALLRRNSSEYKLPCCILSFSYDKSQKLPLENFTWKINHIGS